MSWTQTRTAFVIGVGVFMLLMSSRVAPTGKVQHKVGYLKKSKHVLESVLYHCDINVYCSKMLVLQNRKAKNM